MDLKLLIEQYLHSVCKLSKTRRTLQAQCANVHELDACADSAINELQQDVPTR